jgi:antitoxin component of MazEF toxin-antitoxin module
MAAAALSVDQAVDIREEDGKVIIEPIRSPAYDLDELLDHMTPESFHEDADFGRRSVERPGSGDLCSGRWRRCLAPNRSPGRP